MDGKPPTTSVLEAMTLSHRATVLPLVTSGFEATVDRRKRGAASYFTEVLGRVYATFAKTPPGDVIGAAGG